MIASKRPLFIAIIVVVVISSGFGYYISRIASRLDIRENELRSTNKMVEQLANRLDIQEGELRSKNQTIEQISSENKQLKEENRDLASQMEALKSPKESILDGEVFIVTKGGQNFKLGLVEVALFSIKDLRDYLAGC